VPDDRLAWNEEKGEWDWSEPDWDEFWKVVRGDGPMTHIRLAQRKTVWDTHAWVREVFAGIPEAA
jgi:ring-1,2-phenylacetyl-CoA epoxidase subunit PaaA